MSDDFCISHGRDHMRRDRGPISYCTACEQSCCEHCDAPTANPENEYGEFVCDDCAFNRAEAAYERHCEDFHDGAAMQFKTLQQQQIEARRLK